MTKGQTETDMTKPEYEAARKLRISIEAARKRWKKESDAACSPHGILNLDAKAAADAIYAVALHYAQNEYVDTVVREAISMPRASKQDSKQDCEKARDQPFHLGKALLKHLPFQLTAAQQRVLEEILTDMQRRNRRGVDPEGTRGKD